MLIRVTEKHLRDGRFSSRNLPVCHALRDAGFTDANSDGFWLELLFDKHWHLELLPNTAHIQMLNWLRKPKSVKPFNFRLNRKLSTIKEEAKA